MARCAVIEFLRLGSKRLPSKILERVGGERLLDRGLRMLRDLGEATGVPVYVAAWAGDAPIVEAARRAGVEWHAILAEHAEAEDWLGIYSSLRPLADRFDSFFGSHVTCHPFARLDTWKACVAACMTLTHPFHAAIAERTVAWTRTNGTGFQPVLSAETLNTKTCQFLARPAHFGTGFGPADLWTDARVATADPLLLTVQPIELLDCDTDDDLDLMRLVADGMSWRELHRDRQTDAPDLWCDGPLNGSAKR